MTLVTISTPIINCAIILLVTTSPAWASSDSFIETNTGVVFPFYLETGKVNLKITGADWRRELGKPAYALAHYVAYEPNGTPDIEQNLDEFIDTVEPKAILLKGVYPKVPARGIRWAWKRGLKNAGFSDKECLKKFTKVFSNPFRKGDELLLFASSPAKLVVQLNNETLSEWENPDLIRAIWEMSLGEDTKIVDRKNLVKRTRL